LPRPKRVTKTAAAWSPPVRHFLILVGPAIPDQVFLVQSGKPLALAAGSQPLPINLEKNSGNGLATNYILKKPGTEKREIVPDLAFGKDSP